MNRTIVCLCGSTRFYDEYVEANRLETLKGNIVLSCGVFGHTIHSQYPSSEQNKEELNVLHYDKIELADEILVINVDGYIGESTAKEIIFAEQSGKTIRYFDNTPETFQSAIPYNPDN